MKIAYVILCMVVVFALLFDKHECAPMKLVKVKDDNTEVNTDSSQLKMESEPRPYHPSPRLIKILNNIIKYSETHITSLGNGICKVSAA